MPRKIEIEIAEPSNMVRKNAELLPQEDGTERVEVSSPWGPLVVVLGEPAGRSAPGAGLASGVARKCSLPRQP